MRKKLVFILCGVFFGLFSCSEDMLPGNVIVQGTVDLPIRAGTSNWGVALTKTLEKLLAENVNKDDIDLDFNIEVYDVNYGQQEQAFLIYIHSEITSPLNPDDYLKEVADFLYKKDTEETYEIAQELDMSALEEIELPPINFTIPYANIPGVGSLPGTDPITLTVSPQTASMGASLDASFLHALILQGEFVFETKLSQGDTDLDGNAITTTYDIRLEQDPFTYPGTPPFAGLNCSSVGSFTNQDINCNDVKISGQLFVGLTPGLVSTLDDGVPLTATLTIKQRVTKLGRLDLEFTNELKNNLNHQINPLSLADVAKYLNYIAYEVCDDTVETDPTTGLGIQFYFEEMVNGLELALGCNALGLSTNFTASDFKDLEKGKNIIFGNSSAGTMWLDGSRPVSPLPAPFGDEKITGLEFELELRPKNGSDILSIDFSPDGVAPGIIHIEGTAKFFQNWTEAQVNMTNAIKATPNLNEDGFNGQIPEEGEDPIDLSMLAEYIPGFTFDKDSVQAHVYLSGPHQAIGTQNPNVEFWAVYGAGKTLDIGELTMEEDLVTIGDDDLDVNGSYKNNYLPAGGSELQFLDIVNDQPDNLSFTYKIELPQTLTVFPENFQSILDESSGESSLLINSNIAVTIMAMLHLKLNGPGAITFPDMFEKAGDLFGRESPGPLVEKVDVQRMKVTLDFLGSIFNGGHLYIEKFNDTQEDYKNKMIFPNGIDLNGARITVDVTRDTIKKMEENLVYPDVKVIFNEGGTVHVPRNMGIAGIKFEMKGSANVGEFFE